MVGDLILYLKLRWKQFKCIHNYKPDRIGLITGLYFGDQCTKCCKFKDR